MVNHLDDMLSLERFLDLCIEEVVVAILLLMLFALMISEQLVFGTTDFNSYGA